MQINFPFFSSSKVNYVEGSKSQFNKKFKLFANDTNANADLNHAEKIAAVYTCINILATTISKLNIQIKSDSGIINDDIHKLLNYKPNSYTNKQQFYSNIISQLGFCGNSYCQIEKDSKGKAIALHQFPLDYFDEIKLVKNKLYYYNRNDDKLYRGDEILHFKTLSKTDDYFGLSPLQSLQTSLNLNVKSQKTVDNFYSKNANTTKILEYTGAAGSNKKIDEVLDKFEQENSGVGEAGGTIIIPPNFKLSELKLSVEDAKFLETAAFSEKSIAALYGIPVSMLGHSDNKYSTYEQENIAFINNTISGLLSIITTELEFKLLTDTQIANNYQIEFDAEKLAGTTAADKATYYKTLKDMGVLSPNQVAAKLGYQTTDNEYMDYHYTQMQYVPLEKWLDSVNSLKSVGFSKPAVDSSEEKNKEIL